MKENWPLLVAAVLVIGGLYALSQNAQGGTSYAAVPSIIDPAAPTAAQQVAIQQSNIAAATSFDNGLFSAFNGLTGYAAQNSANTIAAQEATTLQAGRNAATIAGYNSQYAIASLNASTNQSISDANAHAAQQTSLWNGIFSTVAHVIPFFDPSMMVTSNTLPAFGSIGANTASATFV
jgi:hypothetical protein